MENTLLNLIPSSYIPEVHLSQYDIGRELKFKLMDGNTEYSVPSGASVTVKATKPSGLGFVVSGTFSGNIVTVVNTETMTNESGRFSAELSISSGATLLGTSNFIFNIERSPHPEGTTDGDAETLIPELTLLVEEARALVEQAEETAQTVTELEPRVSANENAINVLDARMDTFASLPDGSTSGDAELIDIRVGADGTIYPSAGDAVRDQVYGIDTKIKNIVKNGNFVGNMSTPVETLNWFTSGATRVSIENNAYTFKANSRYGTLRTYETYQFKNGHKYYAHAEIKAYEGCSYSLSMYTNFMITMVGNGDYQVIDSIVNVTRDLTQPIAVIDSTNASSFENIEVKNVIYVDLTEAYGEGNEPDVDYMKKLTSFVNGYFDKYPLSSLVKIILDENNNGSILKNKKIVIFGDSISETNYVTDSGLSPRKTNWVTYAMAEISNTSYYNFATDGASYTEHSTQTKYQKFSNAIALAQTIVSDPDVVIIALGTNDYFYGVNDTYETAMAINDIDLLDKEQFYQAVRFAFWKAKLIYPNASIIATTPTQRASRPIFTNIREGIIKMANTYGIPIIDAGVESPIVSQFEASNGGRYTLDGLHPNEIGKEILGHYFIKRLETLHYEWVNVSA